MDFEYKRLEYHAPDYEKKVLGRNEMRIGGDMILSNAYNIVSDRVRIRMNKLLTPAGELHPSEPANEVLVDRVTLDIIGLQNRDEERINQIAERTDKIGVKNEKHFDEVMDHKFNYGIVNGLGREIFLEQTGMSNDDLINSKFGLKNRKLSFLTLANMSTKDHFNIQSEGGAFDLKTTLKKHGYTSLQLMNCIDISGPTFSRPGYDREYNYSDIAEVMKNEELSHDLEKILSIKGITDNDIDEFKNTRGSYVPDAVWRHKSHGERELFESVSTSPPQAGVRHAGKTQEEAAAIALMAEAHGWNTIHHLKYDLMPSTILRNIFVVADVCTYQNFLGSVNSFRSNYGYCDEIKDLLTNTYHHILEHVNEKRHLENPEIRRIFKNFEREFDELNAPVI